MLIYPHALRLMAVFALICALPHIGVSGTKPTGKCLGEPAVICVLEEELAIPSCGPFTLGLVMKFKTFDKPTNTFCYIGLVVLCPNIYGKKFFLVGNKYRVTCKGRVESTLKKYSEYMIVNKYAKYDMPTYIVDKIQLLR